MKKFILTIGVLILLVNNAFALNLSRVKTWGSEVLTAADLNAEFDNILNLSITNADVSSTAAILGSKLDLAIPGVIGGTTAAAGTFTNLTSTGNTALGNGADTLTINSSSGITYTPAATWTFTASQTVSGTWADLGIATTIDINGGTADNVVVGGSTAAAATVTTLTTNGNVILGDAAADTVHFNANTLIDFEGATADGIETILVITDPTVSDKNITIPNAHSVTLPAGAAFFMITGSCPAGTTDVTSTYSNKFLRVNATGGSTGGADTHTHAAGSYAGPSHTHPFTTGGIAAFSGGGLNSSGALDSPHYHTGTTDAGGTGAVTGTSASGDNVPAYVTGKLCQVD